MNDASDSSEVIAVKLVELDYERSLKKQALMKRIEPLTPQDRAKLFASRSMRVVSLPMAVGESPKSVFKNAHKVYDGKCGMTHPLNVAAFDECIALGNAIKRGDAAAITRKHGASVQTVHKMLKRARGENLPKTNRRIAQ